MSAFERSVLSVYVAYALQSFGTAISWQFVTHWVKNDLGTPDFITLTVVWATPAFVTMVAVNLWGAISDRVEKRKPFMLVGFLAYSGTFVMYSLVTTSMEFLIAAIIGSFFYSAALPMGQAHLTSRTERKGERLGHFLAWQSAGWFCGAVFSGFTYQPHLMSTLYQIASVICVTAFACCAAFIKDLPFEKKEEESQLGFLSLIRRPGIGRLSAAMFSSQVGINALAFLMAIMIIDELGGAPYMVGISNGGATAIAVAITGYVGTQVDRRGPTRILIFAYVTYILFSIGFGLVRDPVLAVIMWSLPLYPLAYTAAYALGAVLSNEEERGRAMSLLTGAQNGGAAVGPIVGGLLAEFVFNRLAQPISFITLAFNFVALLLAYSLLRSGIGLVKQDSEEDSAPTQAEPLSH
ncbi:MAG: MFS transporter [Candidatus Thorarchaeota archaeon]|nr:MAG: MFS transporter [Candidatus Thorarchaeota archaeon]